MLRMHKIKVFVTMSRAKIRKYNMCETCQNSAQEHLKHKIPEFGCTTKGQAYLFVHLGSGTRSQIYTIQDKVYLGALEVPHPHCVATLHLIDSMCPPVDGDCVALFEEAVELIMKELLGLVLCDTLVELELGAHVLKVGLCLQLGHPC